MSTDKTLPLALSMGDPAGIGPEIIVEAFIREPELMQVCVVAGDLAVMQRAWQVVGARYPGRTMPQLHEVADWLAAGYALTQHGTHETVTMRVLQACTPASPLPVWGQVQQQAGRMACDSIEVATRAVLQGRVAALVTAPIHKEALALAGVPYPGHTEMLQALAAEHAGVPLAQMPVRMMLANPELRTVLNSIHVSLRKAIDAVTTEQLLQTLRITNAFLLRTALGRQRTPRIALAGLNPHAGEGGLFGDEELTAIIPARDAALAEGIQVTGPFPPDTVYMQARRHAVDALPFCDAVIAMYHDQGLIPVKYLGVEHGVNVTLGLPLIRTSPDHGTAFDLAGTATADSTSLREAVRMARALAEGA